MAELRSYMRDTTNRKGRRIQIQKSWINQSDFLPVVSRRTVNSTRLLNNINVGSARQSECEFTKRSSQGFGLITGSFIWSILGGNAMNTATYLNTDSLPWKQKIALVVQCRRTFSGAE